MKYCRQNLAVQLIFGWKIYIFCAAICSDHLVTAQDVTAPELWGPIFLVTKTMTGRQQKSKYRIKHK